MRHESRSRKRKNDIGINIGSASILMIFVVLCLVSFAVLAIVSANADWKLTNRVTERTTAYYEACNTAERSLATLDAKLLTVYESAADSEEYFATVGQNKSYVIEISDLQSLQVTVSILYPKSEAGPFYEITTWQVMNVGELEGDEGGVVIEE